MGAPLYEALADRLRRQITRGTITPGSRLPSETELQREHGLSRDTVRRALALLAREGLVVSGQGRGWWVRESKPLTWHASRPERNTRTDLSPSDAWAHDVRSQGREPSEQIQVGIEVVDPFIRERLELETDALVVVRKRLRFVDGEIAMLADTYYPHELVAGTAIAEPADVLPGVYVLMEQMGHGWDDAQRTDEIRSRPASREEAEIFRVEPGHAVTEHVRTRRTEKRRPVAVAAVVAPGDRVVIKYQGV